MGGTFITPEISNLKIIFFIKNASLSYIMTNYLWGYLFGIILFALISKKYGGILSIRLGLLISILGISLQWVSLKTIEYDFFLIGRIISGMGLSSGLTNGFAIIKDNISTNQEKKYFSLITISFTGAIYLSILLSATLFKKYGINSVFKIEIYYSVILLLLSSLIPDTKNNTSKIKFKNFLSFRLISFSIALSLTTIIAYSYALYAPLIMINHFGLSSEKYAYYNLINLIGLFTGSILYRAICSIIKEQRIIILSLLFLIFFCILLCGLNKKVNIEVFILLFFFINIFSGMIYPAATYKSLESSMCKKGSSATMNLIKIGMPSIAIFISSLLTNSAFFNLSVTIILFSILSLILLYLSSSKHYLK